MKSEEGRRRKRKHKKYNQIVNIRLGNCSPVTGKVEMKKESCLRPHEE